MPAHFSPELFRFLGQLRRRNERAWFEQNKGRYHREVRDPMLRFVADAAQPLRAISPAVVADPRPVGGSMFRIHRDTRFSRDKSPYKTHAAAHFRHRDGAHAHAPGFYLHLEPGRVIFGAGIWHPDAAALASIRGAILDSPDRWTKLMRDRALRSSGKMEGESLKRPPRGIDPAHPLIEDLKRKDFTLMGTSSQAEAVRPDFLKRFALFCRRAAPLNAYLAGALGLEW